MDTRTPVPVQDDKFVWAPARPDKYVNCRDKLKNRQLMCTGGIQKSQSFKLPSEIAPGSKLLPEVHSTPQDETEKKNLPIVPTNDPTTFTSSSTKVPPISLKSTLFRAVSYRGPPAQASRRLQTFRKNLAPVESATDPTSPNNDNPKPDVMTLDTLQFTIQTGFGRPPTTCDLEGLIKHYEERVRFKTQDFPSVRLQQNRGPNYISSWNWIKHVQRLAGEVTKNKVNFETRDVKSIQDSFDQLLWQVSTCQSILSKIRLNFDCGLEELDVTFENQVELLTKDFRICRVGERGTGSGSLNIGMIPYIHDVFKSEKMKQDKYKKWFIKTTNLQNSKRDELVKWVKKTGVSLSYAPETVHCAAYLIDAFLNVKGNEVSNHGWALLGIAALQIASKLEETNPVTIKRLIRLSGRYFKTDEVNWMERLILEKLKFDVYPPTAPLFVQMMVLCGSLEFPNTNIQKIVLDLSLGILYQSLDNQRLFHILPMDKAKAALEIATEFTLHQYRLYSGRQLKNYDCVTGHPGKEVGEFATNLCYEIFLQRFRSNNLRTRVQLGVTCAVSPVREVNAS